MRFVLTIVTLGLFAAFAASSLANAVDGKWNVTLTGAVASTCVAEIQRSGKKVTGEITCREAGLKLPISGEIQGNRVVNTATAVDSGWTATLGANAGSGTYMSPMGPGSWTAQRQE